VLALNDVVVEKLARDRQASVAVYVSRQLLGYYSADAPDRRVVPPAPPPTASRPAVPSCHRHVPSLVFTPVAPHMIFDRSLILDARRERVTIKVLEHSGQVAVSVDGQLAAGSSVPATGRRSYARRRTGRSSSGWGRTIFLHRVRERFSPGRLGGGAGRTGTAPDFLHTDPLPDDLAHPGPPDLG